MSNDDKERLQYAKKLLAENVNIDKKIRGGIPVVKGTLISVGQILVELVDRSLAQIADDWDLDLDVLKNIINVISIQYDVSHTVPETVQHVIRELMDAYLNYLTIARHPVIPVVLSDVIGTAARLREQLEAACRKASAWVEFADLTPSDRDELLDLLRTAEKRLNRERKRR